MCSLMKRPRNAGGLTHLLTSLEFQSDTISETSYGNEHSEDEQPDQSDQNVMPIRRSTRLRKQPDYFDIRFLFIPGLVGRFPFNCLSRASISEIHSHWYCFSPILFWEVCVQQHWSGRLNQSPVEPFSYTILLWCFGDCFLVSYPLISQVLLECVWCILATIVCSEGFEPLFALPFNKGFPLKKTFKHLVLALQSIHPCVPRLCRAASKGASVVFTTNTCLTETDFVWWVIVELFRQLLACNSLQVLFSKMTIIISYATVFPCWPCLLCLQVQSLVDNVQDDTNFQLE